MAYNAYLDQFLMFYSQSDAGNGLTRGLDNEIARRTYVPTKLDRQLTTAILDQQFRLVILTGNAGDGKTAFIQKIEEAAQQRGAVVEKNDSLGGTFALGGRTYATLYDGSVETEITSNQEMLTQFFAPFAGENPPKGDVCLVVAINEGKLRAFLSHVKGHRWLSTTLLDHLQRNTPLPNDVVLVNLNLRAVVDASQEMTDCLFDRILDRYVAAEFWAACEECPSRHRCPVKFNVDTFSIRSTEGLTGKSLDTVQARNAAARKARSRLKTLFQILHFRKRLHVTVRDLRSLLAFTLFGKKTCPQIEAEIQSGEHDFIDRYYYNALFDLGEKDRVIGLLREFDVGFSSSPRIDSRLSFSKPRSPEFRRLFQDFDDHAQPNRSRSRIDEDDLLRMYNAKPMSPEERTPEALESARKYVTALRRKLYFEGVLRDSSGQEKTFLDELIPYDNVGEFMRFIETGTDPNGHLKQAIIFAISKSESIYDEHRGKENICIRTRHEPNAKVKAFFTYPADHFTLGVDRQEAQSEFIEFLPASILLKHHDRNITLETSLDLYEMLMRIRDGYVPAAGEMRAFFLNLLMFKKQLMSMPSERLLLTETDYQLYQLKRTPQNGIALSLA